MARQSTQRIAAVGLAFLGGGLCPLLMPYGTPYWVFVVLAAMVGAMVGSLVWVVWPR